MKFKMRARLGNARTSLGRIFVAAWLVAVGLQVGVHFRVHESSSLHATRNASSRFKHQAEADEKQFGLAGKLSHQFVPPKLRIAFVVTQDEEYAATYQWHTDSVRCYAEQHGYGYIRCEPNTLNPPSASLLSLQILEGPCILS